MTYDELEAIRQKIKQKQDRIFYVGFLVILLTLFFFTVINVNASPDTDLIVLVPTILFSSLFPGIFIITILAVIFFFISSKDQQEYRRGYKAHFVTETLAKLFTNITYNHSSGVPEELLQSTGVMSTGDIYDSNDLVSAKYKDVGFIQGDVHIQEEYTDSDGDTHYTTTFRGRWLTFEFHKKFNFTLAIIGKSFGSSTSFSKKKLKKIELESSEFHKNFKVYGEDGFEAFYLLDPASIERIHNLGERYKNRILLCFSGNKLHIAINDNKDSMEPPSVRKPIDEKVEFDKVYTDLKMIIDLVDDLKIR